MGKKLKLSSSKLTGLRRSGVTGLWEARKVIPASLRPALGKSEFKQALNTRDENEAMRLAAGLLADWSEQIAAARSETVLSVVHLQRAPISRDRAYVAIRTWESARIANALDLAFNGMLTPAPVGFSDEMADHVRMVGELKNGDWTVVPDFDTRLSSALNENGIICDPLHPAIPAMRPWFCDALANVERSVMEYRRGNLSDAPEAPSPPSSAMVPPEPVRERQAPPKAGLKLLGLFDLWESSKGKSEKRHRGYVKRLVEFLGDPDLADITPLHMDAFLVELRKFPNTKKPVDAIPFTDLIAKAQNWDDYRTLHIKTVWNWTVVYKALFEFAVDRDLIRKNPAAKMMRKPALEESEERLPYDAADIEAAFTASMFHGFTGNGYRDHPGSTVTKDHKYWLPILALWTGARVEELASLHKGEIKTVGGIHFIDLTERPLSGPRRVKNRSARRVIPLHDKLVALGFMTHVAEATGMLFPELEKEGQKASTDFIKWWGRWCDNQTEVKGQGLGDPAKVFHSFRHAWKRAARASDAKEEIHDLISGHSDGNSVARGYGRGVDLRTLKSAMDHIDFPSFPPMK